MFYFGLIAVCDGIVTDSPKHSTGSISVNCEKRLRKFLYTMLQMVSPFTP